MGMMGGLPPQVLQALMAQMAQQKGQQTASGPGAPPTPQIPPGQMPPTGQPSGGPPRLGGNNVMLPGGTAAPGIPGVQMSATPPKRAGNTTGHGMMAIPAAVMQAKQNKQRSKTEQARQLAGQYLAMKNSDDPKVQQAADQLLADPKNHKVFDKAVSDPSSPEYAGVQMAYRDQLAQEQQGQAMQEMRAKVQEQQAAAQQKQALAAQEQAKAADLRKQTEQRGTVTELDQAKLDAKMEQVTAQIKAKMLQTQTSTQAMLQAVNARVAGAVKVAGIKEQGAKTRQASKIDTYILGEYKALQGQLNELDRQTKDLTSHLDKTTHWYSDPDDKNDVQQQLAQIDAQRGVLMQQYQMLQQKDQAFQRSGLVAPPQSTTPGPNSVTVHDFSK
jgi:hypothetical protein